MASTTINVKKRDTIRSAAGKAVVPKKKTKGMRKLSAAYFETRAIKAKGPDKFLVMLEMNKYISQSLQNGVTFKELKRQGFKFATV